MKFILKIYPYLSTLLGITLVFSFFIIFYDYSKPLPDPIQIIYQTESASLENPIQNSNQSESQTQLTVHIDGAIKNPGQYFLSPGSIIYDAIQSAGGLNKNANLANADINSSSLIFDNMTIFIPSTESDQTTNSLPAFIETSNIKSDLININTASITELMELSGVGEVTAQKIIDYRTTNPFDTIDEIKEVNGIGEKSFEKIKDYITT